MEAAPVAAGEALDDKAGGGKGLRLGSFGAVSMRHIGFLVVA